MPHLNLNLNLKSMELKTIIEVEAWGDFNMKYTECIMVSTKKFNVDELYKEFYNINNIKSNTGLDYRMLYSITTDFIAFLELKGFTKLVTNKISFSD